MTQSYYIYIEPYVEIDVVGDRVLFTNILDRNNLIITDRRVAVEMSKLMSITPQPIILTHKLFHDLFDIFIAPLRNNFMGDYLVLSERAQVPLTLPKINSYIDSLLKRLYHRKNYITDIVVDIRNKSDVTELIKIKIPMSHFLQQCNIGAKPKILIKIHNSEIIDDIFGWINDIKYARSIILRVYSIKCICGLKSANTDIAINSIQCFIKNVDEARDLHNYIDYLSSNDEIRLFVASKNEYDFAQEIYNSINRCKITIRPDIRRATKVFLNEFVLLDESELLKSKLTRLDFIRKLSINPIFWGNIFISVNGEIYSNLYGSPIGTIHDSPMDISLRCIEDNNSLWRACRPSISPCNKCIYRLLCPPISNMEIIYGRYNLCNIK